MFAPAKSHVVETIPAESRVWFVSDLHLGDGTPSDVFFGKDRQLMALIDQVDREGAVLVVVGDAMDFHQAWTFTRILQAHQELLGAMSRLARGGRLFYVIGNHDHDISFYRDILNFRVCDELHVGDVVRVQHGYEYDEYIGADLAGTHVQTKLHHLVERYLNTWIRIPLAEFYTLAGRLSAWSLHKLALGVWVWGEVFRRLGQPRFADAVDRRLTYVARSNAGDPMCIFRNAWAHLATDGFRWLLCGHSHLPGVVRRGDGGYVNTGSWTFGSSNFAVWDGTDFVSRDWMSGRTFGDDFYQPMLDGSLDELDFWIWWRSEYMGWLRFRTGEERAGRLRNWESHVRDRQTFSQLAPLKRTPLLPPPEDAVVDKVAS